MEQTRARGMAKTMEMVVPKEKGGTGVGVGVRRFTGWI